MEKNEKLYKNFLGAIDNLIKISQQPQGHNGIRKDKEYVEARMRLNVIEIFQRMFILLYGNIFVELKNKEFQRYAEDFQSKERGMQQAYYDIFDKITSPWASKGEKDKLFGREEEYNKELLKIETAKELKDIFNSCYEDAYKEI